MKTVGYIKLHRVLNNWEWKTEPKMMALFVHLLLNANYENSTWRGVQLKPGQLIVGRKTTSVDCGISEGEYRVCMERLLTTNEITIQTTNHYSVLTLVNWAIYQSKEDTTASQPTNKQPANQPTNNHESSQQTTTDKEVKKLRNKELSSLSKEEVNLGKFRGDEKFLDLWKSYLEIRKEFNRSNNKTTLKSILNNLKEWENENTGNATTSLSNAVKGGYFTLKEPKIITNVTTNITETTDIEDIRAIYAKDNYINRV